MALMPAGLSVRPGSQIPQIPLIWSL